MKGFQVKEVAAKLFQSLLVSHIQTESYLSKLEQKAKKKNQTNKPKPITVKVENLPFNV